MSFYITFVYRGFKWQYVTNLLRENEFVNKKIYMKGVCRDCRVTSDVFALGAVSRKWDAKTVEPLKLYEKAASAATAAAATAEVEVHSHDINYQQMQ